MNNRTTEQQNNSKELLKLKKRLTIVCILLCCSLVLNLLVVVKKKDKILEKFACFRDIKIEQTYVKNTSIPSTLPKNISVLFIGNSLTNHNICSYWWGKWGMAASSREKDYVHKTVNLLRHDYEVEYDAINSWGWETMFRDRAEALEALAPILQKKHYDVIVVQLGENIQDTSTLAQDFPALIKYIAENQDMNGILPRIILVGDFWKNVVRQKIKQATCKSVLDKNGKQIATFVDLSDMWKDKSYQSAMDTTVYGDDGVTYKINHEGVAAHPGDKGMEEIARRIYKAVKEK